MLFSFLWNFIFCKAITLFVYFSSHFFVHIYFPSLQHIHKWDYHPNKLFYVLLLLINFIAFSYHHLITEKFILFASQPPCTRDVIFYDNTLKQWLKYFQFFRYKFYYVWAYQLRFVVSSYMTVWYASIHCIHYTIMQLHDYKCFIIGEVIDVVNYTTFVIYSHNLRRASAVVSSKSQQLVRWNSVFLSCN